MAVMTTVRKAVVILKIIRGTQKRKYITWNLSNSTTKATKTKKDI